MEFARSTDDLAAALDVYADAYQDLYTKTYGGGRVPISGISKGIEGIAESVRALRNCYAVETIRDQKHMEEFETGTPFMIMIEDDTFAGPVLAVKDKHGVWHDTIGWTHQGGGVDPLSVLWKSVVWYNAVVIALPAPIAQ